MDVLEEALTARTRLDKAYEEAVRWSNDLISAQEASERWDLARDQGLARARVRAAQETTTETDAKGAEKVKAKYSSEDMREARAKEIMESMDFPVGPEQTMSYTDFAQARSIAHSAVLHARMMLDLAKMRHAGEMRWLRFLASVGYGRPDDNEDQFNNPGGIVNDES